MCHPHAVEHCDVAMEKKDVLPFAARHINLEGIVLSDMSRQVLPDFIYM